MTVLLKYTTSVVGGRHRIFRLKHIRYTLEIQSKELKIWENILEPMASVEKLESL